MGWELRTNIRRWALGSGICAVASCASLAAVYLDDPQPPAGPSAKAAIEVLERNCARCHQEGRLVGRERPAGGLGNILNLQEIGNSPALIVPGNPYGSNLFKTIIDG